MPIVARALLAAATFAIGMWAAGTVRGLVRLSSVPAGRLGFEMMGIAFALAVVAFAGALLLPGRVTDRLGLRAGRLPTRVVVALMLGTLGLSQALGQLVELTRSMEGSVMMGIARNLEAARGWNLAVALVGTGLAPAFGEELLCRGLLQRSVAARLGPIFAIALSAFVFGVIHMDPLQGFVATVIGVYLGLAAYWADSTRPAIAAHAANNIAAVLGSAGLLTLRLPQIPSLVGGIGLAVLAGVWAWRSRPRGGDDRSSASLQPQPDSTDP